MQTFQLPITKKITVLALGAESAGNFSVYENGKIHFSEDFGDILNDTNFSKFKKSILTYLKKNKIIPTIILTDLHPLMQTTLWGEELAKKFKAKHLSVQHHHAHLFSSIGDFIIQDTTNKLPNTLYGITMDGTGLGTDEMIWGGEVFKVSCYSGRTAKALAVRPLTLERIGHLENQTLLGGELAIREPARMLFALLSKFLDKKEVYNFIKKYYTKQEFEVLYNQLHQNFNCLETSSTGRVLDAVSLLLGFCGNERAYKHAPINLLEKNSTQPYSDLKPKITQDAAGQYVLDTSYVISYVISALGGSTSEGTHLQKKDKKRLAATVQHYIAQGLWEIIKKNARDTKCQVSDTFISGGLAKNKIIANYLGSSGAYLPKNIPPGDAGLSFGQMIWYFSS